MIPVVLLCHNCLELTKKCVASIETQDVDTGIYIFDNASTDGTREWAKDYTLQFPRKNVKEVWEADTNEGVSRGWNVMLSRLFIYYDHVLVPNNDTILPPWFISELLSYDVSFVTGVAVDKMEQIAEKAERTPLGPHPDFSAFLIRRDCWEKVGTFDESMLLYCGDCDYHVRAVKAGIQLWKSNTPYYHERSSTARLASPEDQRKIYAQAEKDREAFQKKWGCVPGTPEYNALFDTQTKP